MRQRFFYKSLHRVHTRLFQRHLSVAHTPADSYEQFKTFTGEGIVQELIGDMAIFRILPDRVTTLSGISQIAVQLQSRGVISSVRLIFEK